MSGLALVGVVGCAIATKQVVSIGPASNAARGRLTAEAKEQQRPSL